VQGTYYSYLVRLFYSCSGGELVYEVKGIEIVIDDYVWVNVAEFEMKGHLLLKILPRFRFILIVKGTWLHFKVPTLGIQKPGGMKNNERLLAFIIAWVLVSIGTNHTQLSEYDMVLIYAFKNGLQLH